MSKFDRQKIEPGPQEIALRFVFPFKDDFVSVERTSSADLLKR